jgi:hypothetical protein
MLYDVFISVLAAVGITGGVIFSIKTARSPVRRVGVVREFPNSHAADQTPQTPQVTRELVLKRMQAIQAKAGEGWPEFADAVYTSHSHGRIIISSKNFSHSAKYKKAASPFPSYVSIVEPAESSTPVGLQDKVKELDERLKKLESETLRKSQERQEDELERRSEFIQ